jgi:hypothetical protein
LESPRVARENFRAAIKEIQGARGASGNPIVAWWPIASTRPRRRSAGPGPDEL